MFLKNTFVYRPIVTAFWLAIVLISGFGSTCRAQGELELVSLLGSQSEVPLELQPKVKSDLDSAPAKSSVQIIVLGIAQDAGFPQAGCGKICCQAAWKNPSLRRNVASLGLIDHSTGQQWLFDCSPDFPDQLRMMNQAASPNNTSADKSTNEKTANQPARLDGIFLTHAHIGHYAGLIHLGREVMGAKSVPTYTMPRMSKFLQSNGPWSQLVKLKNIQLKPIQAGVPIKLNDRISVTPFQVPHRDEFSETVGFKIAGPDRTVVFLPDIDKWSKWDQSIQELIKQVDVAYLDGTFFENGEIPGRDMALIPHPFVKESINHFSALDETERKKVRFIHFNHTNPVLQPGSNATRQIQRAGMGIAVEGETTDLSDR